jgi:hypothetical protein
MTMPGYGKTFVALTTVAGNSNGPWFALSEYDTASLAVVGRLDDTIEVWGSNDNGVQTAPSNEFQIGADIVADGSFDFDAQAKTKWCRIKKTAGTTVGVVCTFHGFNT